MTPGDRFGYPCCVNVFRGASMYLIHIDRLTMVSIYIYMIQDGAPKIAKLVYNSNNYGLWYV